MLALLVSVCPLGAVPRQGALGVGDLTDLSLEDLLNIKVTSVGRREQRVSQSASAVYVITQEDIRRSGVTTIPDALRLAPGVQVGQLDGNKWVVSIRGFHGRFGTQLLVMIDGRSIYNAAFAGVYWEANEVLLEDIDRIEVIRGPGATLWGANAVNGVINIITKHTRDTEGATITAGGGDQEGGFGSARVGGAIGPNLRYRFYSSYFSRSGSFLESGARAADNWLKTQGGFRVDWEATDRDAVMFTGDVYEGDAGDRQSIALLEPPYQSDVNYRASFSGSNLFTRWTRKHSERASTQVQAYYDRSARDDLFIRDTVFSITDIEIQHQRDFTRHSIIGGVGFRLNQHNQRVDWVARYDPRRRMTSRVNTFLQDEIALVPNRLLLTVGSKLERSTFADVELQPSASLLWNRTPDDTLWFSFSRATRSPARVEHDVVFTAFSAPGPDNSLTIAEVFSNPKIHSERMLNYEAGYRFKPRAVLTLDLAAFYNLYKGVVTTVDKEPFVRPGPPVTTVLPSVFENSLDPVVYGAEAAMAWRPSEAVDVRFNYSFLQGGATTSSSVPGPHHQFHTRWFWRFRRGMEWQSGYFYVDGFSGVPAYHRIDSRFGWRPVQRLEVSAVGQNLTDNHHRESPPVVALATEVGRSLYAKISWQVK